MFFFSWLYTTIPSQKIADDANYCIPDQQSYGIVPLRLVPEHVVDLPYDPNVESQRVAVPSSLSKGKARGRRE
jgi:hypothetical protein